MAKRRRIRWDRVAVVFGPLFLLILIIGVSCHHKEPDTTVQTDPVETVTSVLTQTTDITTLTSTTEEAEPVEKVFDHLVICVDAGHGGDDGGATDQKQKRFEKDDNLQLAMAVRDAFLQYPNVEVIMTRETDEFIELQERCDIANNANADFFISLHRNAADGAKGVEIWINNNDNTWDKLMAEYILDWLDKVGISERRGIQTGFRNSASTSDTNNYYVNRYTNMPSCLIEMGFMNSADDNRLFDEHKDEYAKAIAAALIELLNDKGLYTQAEPQ